MLPPPRYEKKQHPFTAAKQRACCFVELTECSQFFSPGFQLVLLVLVWAACELAVGHRLASSAALMTSDEAQPVTPGKMSQRQGKEGHPIQTKELLQPSALSPGVSYSIGYGASMMKEEGVLRRRFSTCAGVTAVFSPRTDGRKLVRNASFGGYNELSPVLSG
ncbi:UNVERIFIED_CONTAM: hypothetical protein FKN15_006997 [Acipenser sinensis]